MCKEVIVIGASGHGKVITDIIKKSGDKVFCYLDDDTSKENVAGEISVCENFKDKYFIIAIGNSSIRQKIVKKYPHLKYYTAIHPTAVIADDVNIGCGTVVMANAVINSEASIGEHCIINTSSIVEHECIVKDYVHISPGAVLCGNVHIGKGSHIGASATVKNNISVCDDVVVGCGGCVVKDIDKSGVYSGVPVSRMD